MNIGDQFAQAKQPANNKSADVGRQKSAVYTIGRQL